ncbi:MAG: phage protease [Deltaproteobacteria bacterium]|jgi:phage I-like protein|nr:phage protease [Deltaproteobacteria bacterium]
MKRYGTTVILSQQNHSNASKVPEWIHLIPAGLFVGRDGRGPWSLNDPEAFIENTIKYQAGADIPIDYEHQTISTDDNGQPAPAAGWIKELKVESDGIYGRVEWTSKAAGMIAAKEYRYISPVFYTNEAGELARLASAALVALPNLELRAINKQGVNSMDFLQQLASLLGLAEGATEEAIFSAIKALVESKGEPAVNNKTEDEAANSGEESGIEDLPAAEAELLAAVEQLVTTAEDAVLAKQAKVVKNKTQLDAVMEGITGLIKKVNELDRARKQDRAETLVAQAMKAGKIPPALRQWANKLATDAPETFAELVTNMPVLVANKPFTGRSGGSTMTDEEKAVCKQLGMAEADFVKNKATALTN